MPTTSIDNRRRLLAWHLPLAGLGALITGAPLLAAARADSGIVKVWKTPSCECCGAWMTHLRTSGFQVVPTDVGDTAPIRRQLGLADKYGSCHTALLDGYVIEGHVPAQELRRLLKEKPLALGLAVPGMVVGSPGMEAGGNREAYNVLLVLKDGSSRVYQSYPST